MEQCEIATFSEVMVLIVSTHSLSMGFIVRFAGEVNLDFIALKVPKSERLKF